MENNRCIRRACKFGHVEVLKKLLADPRVDPTVRNNRPLKLACKTGLVELVRLLVDDGRVNISSTKYEAFYLACLSGKIELVTFLLDSKTVNTEEIDPSTALRHAINAPSLPLFKFLIERKIFPRTAQASALFLQSIVTYPTYFNVFLPHANIPAYMNDLFHRTVKNGSLESTELVLKDPNVNPAFWNNKALHMAATNDNLALLELLLADPRVNPSMSYYSQYCFVTACQYGSFRVAKRLLQIPSVVTEQLIPRFPLLLNIAVTESRVEILNLLLDQNIDAVPPNIMLIEQAAMRGYDVVYPLLTSTIVRQWLHFLTAEEKIKLFESALTWLAKKSCSTIKMLSLISVFPSEIRRHFRPVTFLLACEGGRINIASGMWGEEGMDLEKGALASIRGGCLELLKGILEKGVEPKKKFVTEAARRGHAEIVEFLVTSFSQFRATDSIDRALVEATTAGLSDIVELLVNHSEFSSEKLHYCLRSAVDSSQTKIAKYFLSRTDIDPSCKKDYCLKSAVMNGNSPLVKILLKDKRVNAAAENNLAIRVACEYGYTDIAKILLSHVKIVKKKADSGKEIRFEEKVVDPSVDHNFCLVQATRQYFWEIVWELLDDERVDPSTHSNILLRTACLFGNQDLAFRLLEDPRVDPRAKENSSFINLIKSRDWLLSFEFLDRGLVDPSVNNCEAFFLALAHGSQELARNFLEYPTVNWSLGENLMLEHACRTGSLSVVELLLQSSKVRDGN